MHLKNIVTLVLLSVVFSTATAQKYASKSDSEVTTKWNETTFSSKKTISDNIKGIPSFSILNEILKDKAITNLLASEEMVTVFLPTDEAFEALPNKHKKELLGNSKRLSKLIQFVAIPGRLDYNSLITAIEKNRGTAYFSTLAGERVGARMKDGSVILYDGERNIATVTAFDFYHKNGFFHIMNGLVFPVRPE
ncbi:fasciclin domain-containing protein [Ulvibacter litoralis]|uniref:Uncaracterized surface protein containing fasciclin (FAS1) repeats n=1 Tax=Ulvibacter litoralis TaxID=227084 RepID=A0A1G7I1S4_9FLAO|nr:fasciclin domain-containing protein [Ulvibacter litoralis]GHC62796.1 hypothetical protein GCM10008083_30020 [Ulvibacter litoralis]SDF06523.1 Uncaracterized surface protein containing fasciclin (FAS1) repeats [Ulvibacter litoralis]